jgi:CheY-like chemotaxis protein
MHEPQKTILIAEDNSDDAFFMRRAFSKTGLPHQLRFVPTGQAAVDYLQGKPPYDNTESFPTPSALVLDVRMPLSNGFEVLEWLKSQPAFHQLPVVVHTTSGLEADRAQAIKLGASAYYVKGSPADLTAMFEAINEKWLKVPARAA